MEPKVVLITGCSSGIGRALAMEFHQRGHLVYASARKAEVLQPLADLGIRTLALDVTDRAAIDAALGAIRAERGRLDMVINNAGYGQFGAAIDLDPQTLRRQFDTNVFAPIELARAALPLMLPRRRGCIVNIGSVSGITTTPFAGAYCASKAALHALSDALRMELAPFGIKVVTVQPGAIKSRMGETGTSAVALPQGSLYASIASAVHGRAEVSQQDPTPAEEFATVVATALLKENPPAVIRYGRQSFLVPFLRRWLPLALLDRTLSRKFGLAGFRPLESE